MIAWVKKLLFVVKNFEAVHKMAVEADTRSKNTRAIAESVEKMIRERTTIHADIGGHPSAENFVLLVGNYRGRAWIRCYGMNSRTFGDMVEQLREMQQHGRLGIVDAPPPLQAVIDTTREF